MGNQCKRRVIRPIQPIKYNILSRYQLHPIKEIKLPTKSRKMPIYLDISPEIKKWFKTNTYFRFGIIHKKGNIITASEVKICKDGLCLIDNRARFCDERLRDKLNKHIKTFKN